MADTLLAKVHVCFISDLHVEQSIRNRLKQKFRLSKSENEELFESIYPFHIFLKCVYKVFNLHLHQN